MWSDPVQAGLEAPEEARARDEEGSVGWRERQGRRDGVSWGARQAQAVERGAEISPRYSHELGTRLEAVQSVHNCARLD